MMIMIYTQLYHLVAILDTYNWYTTMASSLYLMIIIIPLYIVVWFQELLSNANNLHSYMDSSI